MPVAEVLSALAGAVAMTASMLATPPPAAAAAAAAAAGLGAAAPPPEAADESTRTKPGRKPLNDVPATRRTAQNRASQRAFRERRQAHLAELEGKVKRYEAERGAVASQLSVLAQHVRDETPRVHALEAALLARDKEIAQWHARCSDLSRALDAVQAAVRNSSEQLAPAPGPRESSWAHRSSTASRPSLSALARHASSSSAPEDHSTPASSVSSAPTPPAKEKVSAACTAATAPRSVPAITMPTGGADVWTTLPPLRAGSTAAGPVPADDDKWCGGCVKGGECACRGDGIIDFDAGAEAAHVLAPAPALPLRRRSKKRAKQLWLVHASAHSLSDKSETPSSECTGDPRTCGACGADPALAAFCEAVNEEEAVALRGQHHVPPARPPSPSRLNEGEGEGKHQGESEGEGKVVDEASVPEAWRQLRSHPHFASFTHDNHDRAGLHLLADVVAGRDAILSSSGARPASPEPATRKRRRLHVDRDGIRNALAILDRGRGAYAWAATRDATPPSPASPLAPAHGCRSSL